MIVEHTISVTKHARIFTHGNLNSKTKYIWIACHGYGMLAKFFIEKFEDFDPEEHFVIAPEALSKGYIDGLTGRVGASWMTKEDRTNEIQDYINYLESVYEKFIKNHSAKIIGFGFSQGVATITRWANATKKRIDHLVLWAGNPGNELLVENRITNIPIQFILGDKDHFITEEAKIHLNKEFKKAGFNFISIHFDGGHSVDKAVLQNLKFD